MPAKKENSNAMIIARVIPELFKKRKKDELVSFESIQARIEALIPGTIILPEHIIKFMSEQGSSVFERHNHEIRLQKGVRVFDLDEWLDTLEQSLKSFHSSTSTRRVSGFVVGITSGRRARG